MGRSTSYDAVVVGSGPNGLAAAITLQQAGHSVVIFEAKSSVGGGMRSAERTLPGFIHDVCSAIHPLAIASPFFSSLPLEQYGLKWIEPLAALAHPFDEGRAALLERSIKATAITLGNDTEKYARMITPFVKEWNALIPEILSPFHFPKHPLLMGRFALLALRSATGLTDRFFTDARSRAFFAGLAAHSNLPLDRSVTAAFGLMLAILGHATGWPIAQGGSQKIADALASYFLSLGGVIHTEVEVESLDQLPAARAILCDVTPRQLLKIAKGRLSLSYQNALERYRYGPGVYKVDWALKEPIPWKDKECARAGTVHLGGTAEEIAASEKLVSCGECPEKPYVILAQQTLFDPTRAPYGKQTAWGYCHVPNGSAVDMTEKIEAQIERFAPGFRDCIEAKSSLSTAQMESYNANYVGGDINGGVQDLAQLFTRPVALFAPYSTPSRGLYICSSSTPPGGGVHGMCGYFAAHAALQGLNKKRLAGWMS